MSNNYSLSVPAGGSGWPHLPGFVIGLAIALMVQHRPIEQLADYHHFADQREWLGLPHAADVLSNLGFALIGCLGLNLLWKRRSQPLLQAGCGGYALFFGALLLTASGSAFYHFAPSNTRLVFDRLPIALACAGLLAAVWNETRSRHPWLPSVLAFAACLSVWWWRFTDLNGAGDLRPYLLIQALPLVLIPLLQWQHARPMGERRLFGLAIGLYVLAKLFELEDQPVFALLGLLSGHTIKHLIATLAAGMVLVCLKRRACKT
ncbi:alkaline phytoceramidase [Chitinimonas sp. BJB300]|uniref:alkaline phytoceramidase n=1 Tax=Chitinimonas sp. BJB300 TaxID=1559339 RepID=UPI000C11E426|nr:alkaline phytoceramidase [Chitinimonas sp. BJB300]PHV10218.1 alkaline phytoceramidase [Chitinimonas sp. BJB300]TSJ89960.1 alkaline phytoceramidase [Chitinimonas sp. BJB300]